MVQGKKCMSSRLHPLMHTGTRLAFSFVQNAQWQMTTCDTDRRYERNVHLQRRNAAS